MSAAIFLWVASFFGLVASLLYQLYLYLRLGEWVPFSATTVCANWLKISWCSYPTDWVGLHDLLSQCGAGVAVFSAASLILAITAAASE